jgi:Ice-binding-like/Putative Ig domain
MRSGSVLFVLVAAAMFAAGSPALAAQPVPPLESAASFVVLGYSRVTNTGVSRVTGNVGTSPGEVVTGFSSSMFRVGDIRRDDALARQARLDGNAAADALSRQPCDVVLDNGELGGRTLRRGVYCFPSADVRLNGTLILDAEGDREAGWLFHIDGTLTTASNALVLVVGNGDDGNVRWWTGDAATLGAGTAFIGNLFAHTNITLGAGASLSGRAFARTGSVTLDANAVSLCCAPLVLGPATLPAGPLGMSYSQTVTATGGMAPHTLAISSGSLPFGLALAPDGTLHGIPLTAGTFPLTVTATDALGCSSTIAYDLRIDCGPRTILTPATRGVRYSAPLTFDGIAPFSCSISAGMLPPGLIPDGCGISGTPETTGVFEFVMESVDARGARRSRCVTLRVGVAIPTISTWMLFAFSILLAGAGWIAVGRR